MTVLTQGNAAKLYCLQWIEQFVHRADREVRILDLGCGVGLNFRALLNNYPNVHYIGIEPSASCCDAARRNLQGHNVRIINKYAYNIDKLIEDRFDIVVSFSVLEHVYRRYEYLLSASKCLRPEGYFLINYDAGHFLSNKEFLSNTFGPFLARFGIERYYQSFVHEDHFKRLIERIGLQIKDEKFFNSTLKSVCKLVPESRKSDYMRDWLDFELRLNDIGITYDDQKARHFNTRNYILATG